MENTKFQKCEIYPTKTKVLRTATEYIKYVLESAAIGRSELIK